MSNQNLLKQSFASEIEEAMKEWIFRQGVYFDSNDVCGYCGRRSQKMQFKISNIVTKKDLLIGSTCLIHLFEKGLKCIDGDNNDMTIAELKRYIADCRYNQANEMRKKNTLKYLNELNSYCDIGLIIEDFSETGYFDVFIALYLIEEFRRFDINYDRTMFRINISRCLEKENFLNLSKEQYKALKPGLNAYQKLKYEERF